MIVFGTTGYLTNGLYKTMPAQAEKIVTAIQTPRPLQRQITASPLLLDENDSVIGLGDDAGSKPTYLVWGDSHAAALSPALTWEGLSGRMIISYGCLPLLRVNIFRSQVTDGKCAAHNAKVSRYLDENPSISVVFLVARWGIYANTEVYNGGRSKPLPLFGNGTKKNKEIFSAGLRETVNMLKRRKIQVIIATSVPDIGWDVPSILARAIVFNRTITDYDALVVRHDSNEALADEAMKSVEGNGVEIIKLAPVYCPDMQSCMVEKDGIPIYRDTNHLTVFGAKLARPLFSKTLQKD